MNTIPFTWLSSLGYQYLAKSFFPDFLMKQKYFIFKPQTRRVIQMSYKLIIDEKIPLKDVHCKVIKNEIKTEICKF